MVELPKGVHRVVSRGREYIYWSPGRATKHAAKPVRLPSDPTDPKFWIALREAQGQAGAEIVTVNDVLDRYVTHGKFLSLAPGSRAAYAKPIKILRAGFGTWDAASLRPSHIRAVVEGMGDMPGAANTFLSAAKAISSWAVARDLFPASITEGVQSYKTSGGHKPWTDSQLAAAEKHLTGMVRRGFFLLRYTGQRGSDVVRLGETFIDESGFRLSQQKTGREVWVPIDDALAAEMATWERVPGPYLRHSRGPYSRSLLDQYFMKQRDNIPGLAGVTLHGLRATRVVELRRAGLTTSQIQDQVGMSLAMIERYCRFADKKISGKASVVALRTNKNRT